jgi:eukaryotic-like serine/threonine-protein kinase
MSSSAPPKSVAIEPGTRLDRYELLCLLAQGGMANVWLARVQGKHGFNKLLAIKTILPNEADNENFREMFLDEARIASRIAHPSVVHIADVGEIQGIPYLVMDLIEGEPLHKLARACDKAREKLPLGIALRVVADACAGLHAAHELKGADGEPLGVVHRDISPQNILVTTSGISTIIDFGIAKARDRSARQTTAGTLKGKISYMPREQALGKDVDRRADTWALGAVLYFLIKGEPPYQAETQLATLQLAMNAAPIEPLPASVPMPVRALVSRALAQPIDNRFQTAEELGLALETAMQTLGIVTSHTEVAKFLGRVMKEKLEAKKALVANAIAEAAKRETAKKDQLDVSIAMENALSSGSLPSFPTQSADGSGSLPALPSHGSYGTHPGTNPSATFAAQNLDPPQPRRNGVAIATMILASFAILSALGIGALMYFTRMKPVTPASATTPIAPSVTNEPPPPAPIASAPAVAQSATPAASGSTTPAPKPTAAAWKPPPASRPTAGKKRDDEPGF